MYDDEIWNLPLTYWLRDCASGDPPIVPESEWRVTSRHSLPLNFDEICDGVLMSAILRYIDPSSDYFIINENQSRRDSASRQKQLRSLFNALRHFYRVQLQQLIILSTPDVSLIARNSSTDETIDEINKFILLLLGCAIQSDKKRKFVDRITKFDQTIQVGIANYIQQITEGTSIVISSIDPNNTDILQQLEQVMKERDTLVELASIDQDSDEGSSVTTSSSLNGDVSNHKTLVYDGRSPSPNSINRQLTLELARIKQDKRELRNLAENRDEENRQILQELHEKTIKITQLENERLELVTKARHVKDLEDDLQAALHKIEKLQSLESVEKKLREVEDQKEYLQTRYEQVNERCKNQEETIAELERLIDTLQYENRDRADIEKDFQRSKNTVLEMQEEISRKNTQIEKLMDDQYRLEHELKEREERISQLEAFSPSVTPRHVGSLADQLEDAEKEEIANLRTEIRKLRAQTEGATPEPSLSTEIEELKAKLAAEEMKYAEVNLESQKLKVEREQIDGTLDRVTIELEQATIQVENMRAERDEAIHGLHEARRNFAQFQTEFGKKIEEESEAKIRELEFELKESKRRINQYEEDRIENEHHLERVRDEQRKLRFEIDELEEEKNQLQSSVQQAERLKKNAENERNAIRQKTDKLEDDLEEAKIKLMSIENSAKRLEDREKQIADQQNRIGDLESEHRTIQQQLDLELKKTQRLREDLVLEKSKVAEIIGKLRSLCAAVAVNGGKIDTSDIDDEKLVETIDDIIMATLSNAKRDSDALRLQQHQQIAELNDLKKDIEKLRRSESASLTESDDRVRELNQENISMKEQVFILQEKIRELSIELSAKSDEVQLAKSSIEELNRNATHATVNNTELARIQVSLRNAQLQEELLKQENTDLRKQLEQAEKSCQKAKQDLDELESMHKSLLGDHGRLQHLHNLLTRDYEEAKNESVDLRTKLRNTQQRLPMVSSNNREIDDLRTKLAQEKASKDKQLRAYADLQNEHGLARRKLDAIMAENEQLSRNREALMNELRRVRSSDTNQKWNLLMEDVNKQLQAKDLEIAKLKHKIEALTQLNQTYNEENKNLSRQLEILLTQNKELLNRALHDKDQYHLEMKDFQEQLTALRRHKEKLEDKIMDQYRNMESKKTQERKQPLVKRAAKALISRRRTSSQGGSTTEESSAYSADEGGSPPLRNVICDDFDNLVPTCSSSSDHEHTSPRYETISAVNDIPPPPKFLSFRSRGDPIGGSVRLPSSRRPINQSNTYEQIFNRDEKPLISLPPRAPVRNSPATSSLRVRPPPPPYPSKNHTTPASLNYLSRNENSNSNASSPPLFQPRCASTPKPPVEAEDSLTLMNDSSDRPVVAEGEMRTFIREKDERIDKALSYYENVNGAAQNNDANQPQENGANESTVWYEYGCV